VPRINELSLLRRAMAGLVPLLWLLAARGSVPADGVQLEPGEAIILAGRDDDGSLRALDFREYWKKDRFSIQVHDALAPQVVKAGRYSLHLFVPADPHVFPGTRNDPQSLADTFEVKAGSVTYIGDFKTRKDTGTAALAWTVTLSFRPATLLEAKRQFPWLTQYPLYVAKVGERAQPVNWD
jgi:hypothetical protein